jgi:hypothetical protein
MSFKDAFSAFIILVMALVISELVLNWMDSISMPRAERDGIYLK